MGFPASCSSDWQLKKGTRGYTPVAVCLQCRNSQVGTQCKHKSVLSGQYLKETNKFKASQAT